MSGTDRAKTYKLSIFETPLKFRKYNKGEIVRANDAVEELKSNFSEVTIFQNYIEEEIYTFYLTQNLTQKNNSDLASLTKKRNYYKSIDIPQTINTDIFTISFFDKNTKGGVQIIDAKRNKPLRGATFYIFNQSLNQENIIFKMPNQEQFNIGEIGVIINFNTANGWKKIETSLVFLIDSDSVADNPTFIYASTEEVHSVQNNDGSFSNHKMTGFDFARIAEIILISGSARKETLGAGIYPKDNIRQIFTLRDRCINPNIYQKPLNQLGYMKNIDRNKNTKEFNAPQRLLGVPYYSIYLHWLGFSEN